MQICKQKIEEQQTEEITEQGQKSSAKMSRETQMTFFCIAINFTFTET